MKNLIFNQKGQSLVEMALVLPLLLLLLLGIMEIGRILGGYMELQSAARDVARYAAIHKEVNTAGEITPLVNERLTLLDPDLMTVSFTRNENANKKDIWVEVSLDYEMDMMTPFFSSITGNPFNLHSKMVMRVE